MNRIYKGQTALRVTVKTFCDLEDIVSAAIKYKKPDGSVGGFAAGVSDMAKGVIFHERVEGELDMSGWWALWAVITFADGRIAAGELAKVFVWREGTG
jgi:hypothetical protein